MFSGEQLLRCFVFFEGFHPNVQRGLPHSVLFEDSISIQTGLYKTLSTALAALQQRELPARSFLGIFCQYIQGTSSPLKASAVFF